MMMVMTARGDCDSWIRLRILSSQGNPRHARRRRTQYGVIGEREEEEDEEDDRDWSVRVRWVVNLVFITKLSNAQQLEY